MLKKLFTYELKMTYKLFLSMYLAVICFFAFFVLFYYSSSYFSFDYNESLILFINDFKSHLFMFIFFSFIGIFIALMIRFKRCLYGDRAYLIMCLPAKHYQHILARFFGVLFWSFFTFIFVICIFLLIFLVYSNKMHAIFDFPKYREYIEYIIRSFGYVDMETLIYFIGPLFLLGIIYCSQIVKLYLSISISCLNRFLKSKQGLASVGSFILLSFFEFLLLDFVFYTNSYIHFPDALSSHVIYYIACIIFFALFLLYFYFVNKILSNHFNIN